MRDSVPDSDPDKKRRRQIAVIGAAEATAEEERTAYQVGTLLAETDLILLTGGRGGVMEAASKGAHDAGGLVVGIVPGSEGNQFLEIIIKTEMGHARNVILIESADAVIAVGGSYGTLSEIAVALRTHTPVYGLNTWKISGVHHCTDPQEAVETVLLNTRLKTKIE